MLKNICLVIALLFVPNSAIVVSAQGERVRRVRVIGTKTVKPKPRLITTARQTKRTILLPKAALDVDRKQIYGYERTVFTLINQKRTEKGLSRLVFDENLSRLARNHAEDMATSGYFSHIDQNGNTVDGRALLSGVKKWSAIGENIAYNQGLSNPCEFTVKQWLLSPSHRQNLMRSEWIKTGVGVALTKDGRYFFTQIFTR